MESAQHKAGFVSIIGKPNVGKSTLMNAMVGERLSIITPKAQTTRHRIMGILNSDDFQIVYSDTPGVIQPKYELHKAMMRFVNFSLEDADVVLFVTDITEHKNYEEIIEKVKRISVPVYILINKIDLATEEQVKEKMIWWKEQIPQAAEIVPVSAFNKFNIEKLFELILSRMPVHPPYFDKDALTDKPERFFASEIIREKIFENYEQEVPYSCEVGIESFKDEPTILRIHAVIFVERDSQKGIIIGKGGSALKKVGTEARKLMEQFFNKKVYLELYVRVETDWRNKENKLRGFGYDQ